MLSSRKLLALGLVGALGCAGLAVGCGGSKNSGGGGFNNTASTSNTTNTSTNTNTNTNTTGNSSNTNTNTSSNTNTNTSSNTSGSTDPHVAAALAQINESRSGGGLPALVLDSSLTSCGVRHATDCANCSGFNMNNFATCAHGDFKAGDTCGGRSENQGVASGVSEDQAFTEIHQAMMNEGPPPPGQDNHYANIMDPNATAVGIGFFIDSNGGVWISEEFR